MRFLLINVKLILANNAHYLVLRKGWVPALTVAAPEERCLQALCFGHPARRGCSEGWGHPGGLCLGQMGSQGGTFTPYQVTDKQKQMLEV